MPHPRPDAIESETTIQDALRPQPLSDLPADSRAIVRRLGGGSEFMARLTVLGMTEGVEMTVVQNYGRGPIIVRVRDTRIALGRGEALKVLVEALPGDKEGKNA